MLRFQNTFRDMARPVVIPMIQKVITDAMPAARRSLRRDWMQKVSGGCICSSRSPPHVIGHFTSRR